MEANHDLASLARGKGYGSKARVHRSVDVGVVMGVGLLTFVPTDLEAVVAVNRGEQAFELAEAGIEVAKAHPANDSSPADWSSEELLMAGMGEGSVTVTVEYDESGSFEAVSTGEYRETSRKIEATFSVEEGTPKLLSWRELYE